MLLMKSLTQEVAPYPSVPPAKVAVHMADELSLQPHPGFDQRGKQIRDLLVADRWHEG